MFDIFLPMACVTTFFFLLDEALLNNRPTGRGQLVKMLITLEPHGTVYFYQALPTYAF